MARITCKTPSPGRAITLALADVGTSWTTIADAPDFSVPDNNEVYPERDPDDSTRAIRPGEIFFLAPLQVRNKNAAARTIEVRLLMEDDTAIEAPGLVSIPPGETVQIPVQGRSLVKRDADGTNGDRLQVRASNGSSLDLWGAALEKLSSEHIGVVE